MDAVVANMSVIQKKFQRGDRSVTAMTDSPPDRSALISGFGLLIAGVAIVGTRFLGWEWGAGGLAPTSVGVAVAVVAVAVVASRRLRA